VVTIVAVAFVIGLALINFIGVSESVKANLVLTLVELSGPGAVRAPGNREADQGMTPDQAGGAHILRTIGRKG